MSVKVSDTSWFPGGENDAFPALQHFMEIQRLRFTMTYSKRYFALSFFSSKIAPPFFFLVDRVTFFCPQMEMWTLTIKNAFFRSS